MSHLHLQRCRRLRPRTVGVILQRAARRHAHQYLAELQPSTTILCRPRERAWFASVHAVQTKAVQSQAAHLVLQGTRAWLQVLLLRGQLCPWPLPLHMVLLQAHPLLVSCQALAHAALVTEARWASW